MVLPSSTFDQFESHLLGQGLPVVDVGTGVDPSNRDIRAELDASKGVDSTEILDCSLGEQSIVLQVMLDVDAGNRPEILACFSCERDLQSLNNFSEYIPPGNRDLFVHVSEGEPDSWLPIFDADLEMHAEVFFRCPQKFNVQLPYRKSTYRPTRLHCRASLVGSGMVTVLLERMEPVSLNAFLAMMGS